MAVVDRLEQLKNVLFDQMALEAGCAFVENLEQRFVHELEDQVELAFSAGSGTSLTF